MYRNVLAASMGKKDKYFYHQFDAINTDYATQ